MIRPSVLKNPGSLSRSACRARAQPRSSSAAYSLSPDTDSAVYTADSNAIWPNVDLRGPIQLVSGVLADNGVGGSYASDYSYLGGKIDIHGRGFLGFRQFVTTDPQTGVEQTLTFRQDFPFIGSLEKDEKVYTPDGVLLNRTTHSHGYQSTMVGGSQRYFPYVWRTKDESWDLYETSPGPYGSAPMPKTESTVVFDNASTYDEGAITEIGYGNVLVADVFNLS
ncbi:MAG: toxin TcdB middle/N-terminal domain-containing protein, partial [Pseudomonadota bacterium]